MTTKTKRSKAIAIQTTKEINMSFNLPDLPYAMDALQPHISKETLEYHYGKHHRSYVTNLNNLTENSPLQESSLEELIKTSKGGVYNNAAQIWNHTFYWNSLAPNGGGKPTGTLSEKIDQDFGSFDQFKEAFTKASATLFGSGWTFLTLNKEGKLEIVQETNAGNPMKSGLKPLLTCDVWEHAYYVDYRNARPKYLEAFWSLVNWSFAQKNLEA